MTEDQKNLILSLFKTHKNPSLVGHILRDQYNLKFYKLCRLVPELDQKEYQKKSLQLKIDYLKLHLAKNKKDFVSKRSLARLDSKLRHFL